MKEKKKQKESGQEEAFISKGKGSCTLGSPFSDREAHREDREPQRRESAAAGLWKAGQRETSKAAWATLLHFPATQDARLLVWRMAGAGTGPSEDPCSVV